jgi:chorismate dehydratase
VNAEQDTRLRVAAIGFLNPAPLMWDFEHGPLDEELARRYQIDRMTPSECAARLADGRADIGLIPIASLATTPGLQILPGCTIASKGKVWSLILVHRASRQPNRLRSVAADTASRTTLAYARMLFHKWGNAEVPFLPMVANLDAMLERADAAILIGDPALLALEERNNQFERTGEELVYRDLAEEWRALTGLAFVSAVWAIAPTASAQSSSGIARGALAGSALTRNALASTSLLEESIAQDFIRSRDHGLANRVAEDFILSRDHGLANIDSLVQEWSPRFAIPEETIRTYLTDNIHYVLDEECAEGMRGFFRMAAEYGVLPPYAVAVPELAAR